MRLSIEFMIAIVIPIIISLSIYSKKLPKSTLCIYKLIIMFYILCMTQLLGCIWSDLGTLDVPGSKQIANGAGILLTGLLVFDLFRSSPAYDPKDERSNKMTASPMLIPLMVGLVIVITLTIYLMIYCFTEDLTGKVNEISLTEVYRKFRNMCSHDKKFSSGFSLFYTHDLDGTSDFD